MIKDFKTSFDLRRSDLPDVDLITPADAQLNEVLSRSIKYGDTLCRHVFGNCWPHLSGLWGIEKNGSPNASVELWNGEAYVLITSGALELFDRTRHFIATSAWVEEDLYPTLFDGKAPPLSPAQLGEATQLFALTMLFGHELGHVVDNFDVDVPSDRAQILEVAEEISADGHATRVGLRVATAWAKDLAEQDVFEEPGLRKLGVILMVLANALLDDIVLDQSWGVNPRQTHPPAAQRLMAVCVHVNYEFEQVSEGFGLEVIQIVLRGLAALGHTTATDDMEALRKLVEAYDPDVIRSQYETLQRTLADRHLIKVDPSKTR